MSDSITVQIAKIPKDFRQFWQMFDNFIMEMYHHGRMEEDMLEWYLSDSFRDDMLRRCKDQSEPTQVLLFVKNSEHCIGFSILRWQPYHNRCYITAFFIRGIYRGKNLARMSWYELEKLINNQDIRQIILSDYCEMYSDFWQRFHFVKNRSGFWEKKKRYKALFSFW